MKNATTSCCALCAVEAHHAAGTKPPEHLLAEALRPRNPVLAEWLKTLPLPVELVR